MNMSFNKYRTRYIKGFAIVLIFIGILDLWSLASGYTRAQALFDGDAGAWLMFRTEILFPEYLKSAKHLSPKHPSGPVIDYIVISITKLIGREYHFKIEYILCLLTRILWATGCYTLFFYLTRASFTSAAFSLFALVQYPFLVILRIGIIARNVVPHDFWGFVIPWALFYYVRTDGERRKIYISSLFVILGVIFYAPDPTIILGVFCISHILQYRNRTAIFDSIIIMFILFITLAVTGTITKIISLTVAGGLATEISREIWFEYLRKPLSFYFSDYFLQIILCVAACWIIPKAFRRSKMNEGVSWLRWAATIGMISGLFGHFMYWDQVIHYFYPLQKLIMVRALKIIPILTLAFLLYIGHRHITTVRYLNRIWIVLAIGIIILCYQYNNIKKYKNVENIFQNFQVVAYYCKDLPPYDSIFIIPMLKRNVAFSTLSHRPMFSHGSIPMILSSFKNENPKELLNIYNKTKTIYMLTTTIDEKREALHFIKKNYPNVNYLLYWGVLPGELGLKLKFQYGNWKLYAMPNIFPEIH